MLSVAIERLVRTLRTSLSAFLASDVDIACGRTSTVRFGDYLDDVSLPTQLVSFRAEGWDGGGLVNVGCDLAFTIMDALLGGGNSRSRSRADRPFTAIETQLLTRFVGVVLAGAQEAFSAISPVVFSIEAAIADPRLATLVRAGDLAVRIRFELAIDGRLAVFDLVLPHATLEPVRDGLAQVFAGEKLGLDDLWAVHLATEVWQTSALAHAVLHETRLPLGRIMRLGVGDTLVFDMKPGDPVDVRCGGALLTRGRIGRVGDRIAVRIDTPLRNPEAGGDFGLSGSGVRSLT
jgi:flagellar motor switch protein FliM